MRDTGPREGVAERECRAFTRYLTGEEPTDHIVAKYRELRPLIPAGTDLDRIDQFLLAVARGGPLRARMADAYSRIARPTSALRQSLVLLLAVLENCPPHHGWLNRAEILGRARLVGLLAGQLALFAVFFAAGVVTLGPAHLALSLSGGGRSAPRDSGHPAALRPRRSVLR